MCSTDLTLTTPETPGKWYDSLPSCVRFPLADADQERTPDGVHRLIRLIAAYESLIKCLGSVAHAVALESGFAHSRDYTSRFEKRFIGKYPSLGDYLWLLNQHKQRAWKSGPTWFQEIADRMYEQRFTRKAAGDSMVFRLCRAIERHRQSLVKGDTQTYPSAVSVLEHFVTFRNTCFHGSITIRFAKKFDKLLVGAMHELSEHMQLSQSMQFLVPLAFAKQDSTSVVAINPERLASDPRRYLIGDRSALKWEEIYVGPRNSESLEEFVRISPLVIYDRTVDDIRFLNRFEQDEFEYLSHRSGDLDFVSLSDPGWQDAFALRIDEEPSGADASHSVSKESDDDVNAPPEIPTDASQDAEEVLKARFTRLLESVQATGPSEGIGIAERFFSGLTDIETEQVLSEFASEHAEVSRDAKVVIAKALYDLGLHDQSATVLRAARQRHSEDAEILHLLGRSLVMLGKREKSAAKNDHDAARRIKARELLTEGVEALQASRNIGSQTQGHGRRDVFTLSMLVDAHCRLGDFQKAMEACDEGLQLEPENDRLNSQRLYLYERTGS